MIVTFLALTLFIKQLNSQINDCLYKLGPFELDLREYNGRTLFYEGNDGKYYYTPCSNGLICENNGYFQNETMVDYFRNGFDECLSLAKYDSITQPIYDQYIESFIFNYTSNELCTDKGLPQTNRSVLIAYNCNPDVPNPVIVDVDHFNACNDLIQIEFIGACQTPPPPNEECIFRDAGKVLNLSTIQGHNLKYTDSNDHTVVYSPCANNFNCLTNFGNMYNMAEVIDTNGQCVKFLGVWSGDTQVYYDRTIFGDNYYEFYFANGQQCGDGGPTELFNIRYYCGKGKDTVITSFGPSGRACEARMEIETPLACN